jgi:hypothetical protein
VSNDGGQFVVTSPDRRIRVFWFKTGKLRRVYDESLEVRSFSILYLRAKVTVVFLFPIECYYL